MFFSYGYKKKAFQELSIDGQKVESEDAPDTNYEEDDEATPNTTPAPEETPAEPATEEPPVEEPTPEAEPANDTTLPEGETPPVEGEETSADDSGESAPEGDEDEETPNYDIPDDAEPTEDEGGGDDTGDVEGDEGGDNLPNYDDDEDTDTGDNAGGGDSTPDYEDGGDGDTPNYDDNDGEVSSDGEDAESSEGEVGDDDNEGEEGVSGSQLLDDLKSMEDEIFADLAPEQKDARDNELRNRYIDLYSVIDESERRINNIIKNESTARILEFITRKMNELKQLIHHNLTVIFNTRTYAENKAALQECIAIMNTICEMLESISKEEAPSEEELE